MSKLYIGFEVPIPILLPVIYNNFVPPTPKAKVEVTEEELEVPVNSDSDVTFDF